MFYEVIVGNIGRVYSGFSQNEAERIYEQYQKKSCSGGIFDRVYNETVVLMENGEIVKEYSPIGQKIEL